ncbi:hypothetical protein Avbf_14303 [Armadillidium vulgare]|nr:hypothetical protein Avbf_14303 [Armadillidium vulgare]
MLANTNIYVLLVEKLAAIPSPTQMSFIEKVLVFALCVLASVHFTLGFSYGPVVVPDKPSFMDAHFVTDTSIVTRTHTLRKTATSNVYVTSAVLVPVTVTQYSTRRDFIEEDPDTVTSFIRLTSTPVVRLPVQETQTLLQVVYDTITVTSRNFITSTHGLI